MIYWRHLVILFVGSSGVLITKLKYGPLFSRISSSRLATSARWRHPPGGHKCNVSVVASELGMIRDIKFSKLKYVTMAVLRYPTYILYALFEMKILN